jgi:class 3 adenylate cyclase
VSASRPETRYTSVGDFDIAYQVLGEGAFDLLYFWGFGSNIDLVWDLPARELFTQLAAICRVILFDPRGTGSSDPIPRDTPPTWDELTADVGAVLDAVGSDQAVLFGLSGDGGAVATLFAAMHPERVSALVLFNATARSMVADDYPIGFTAEDAAAFVESMETQWGTETYAALGEPALVDEPEVLRTVARHLRACATPRRAAAQYEYTLRTLDVRAALPLVQAPTLVLHTQQNPFVPITHGRYLAEHIGGAKLVELPGSYHGHSAKHASAAILDEIVLFLTGERPEIDIDRILTTVLFTDIVQSTERAAQLGDQRWRSLLDSHDNAIRAQLRRFRGREINTTGDGFVASFDSPGRAIRCAREILDTTADLGIDLRVGLHTGECEVRGEDLGGLAVHIAARISALADPGEILVSSTVEHLVAGSGITFSDRGKHQLKGVPGTWKLFAAGS